MSNKSSSTQEKILNALNVPRARDERPRAYVGASIVGNKCDVALELQLRGYPDDKLTAKTLRIFGVGSALEEVIIRDLKAAGLEIIDRDPLTGRQHSWSEFGGHVRANADGIIVIDDVPHILEIKTMNSASFAAFKKHGVKKAHPKYFSQVTMMMGMSGLRSTVFVALCKDDQEYHVEVVDYDEFEFEYIRERVSRVLGGYSQRIAEDQSSFFCRFCHKKEACWSDVLPATIHCSHCKHSTPTEHGWHCGLHDRQATEVCDDFARYIPLAKK